LRLSKYKHFGVSTIRRRTVAAISLSIGASYRQHRRLTSAAASLKTKRSASRSRSAPLVVVNIQRGGPSTGLPTKTEQADLLQAVYGRNGESPLCVLAASTPGNCFYMAIEAVRLAVKYMTPVMLLTDGYLANGAEPWRIERGGCRHRRCATGPTQGFQPVPARAGHALHDPRPSRARRALLHRVGGLEKDYHSSHISDPDNHELMTRTRAQKIAGIANDIPRQKIDLGDDGGNCWVLGWGSTYGACREAVQLPRSWAVGLARALHWLPEPLPRSLGELLQALRARVDRR
jgi:2-oxoglutarate ferredoxin oxidoreductase subunit alpha